MPRSQTPPKSLPKSLPQVVPQDTRQNTGQKSRNFPRIDRLPPYVFNITAELKLATRRRG